MAGAMPCSWSTAGRSSKVSPHGTGAGGVEEAPSVDGVGNVEALRHEPLDGLPEQLVARVAEHLLDLLVHEQDATTLVDPDDGVRGRVEQLLQTALGRLP